MYIQALLPVFVGEFVQGRVLREPCVVYQYTEVVVLIQSSFYHMVNSFRVGYVGLYGEGLSSMVFNHLYRFFSAFCILRIVNSDFKSVLGQPYRCSSANSPGATSYNCSYVFHFSHLYFCLEKERRGGPPP